MKADSKYRVCFLFFVLYRGSLKRNKVILAYLKPGVGR